jgi:cytochrome P450
VSADEAVVDTSHRTPVFQSDRHTPVYRDNFSEITREIDDPEHREFRAVLNPYLPPRPSRSGLRSSTR